MSSTKRITALFDDMAENMLRFFEGWDTHVPHDGEKGGIRERRVQGFLEKHLPNKYGVASGHIVDKQGTVSLQEDIVIFDQLNCPVLKVDPYYQVFPCETVYATVEVKSILDSTEISKCIEHTHQLTQLDRGELGSIESFVFAYDSYESKEMPPPVWARNKFKEKASSKIEQKPMPSVVLCLKKGFILHFGVAENVHITSAVESGVLLYYFDLILSRLSQVHTKSPLLFIQYGWPKSNPIKRYE